MPATRPNPSPPQTFRPSRRKLLLTGVGALAGAGVLVAPGGRGLTPRYSDPDTLDLFWYVEGKRARHTIAAARAFERRHDGVTVNTVHTGFDSYFDKLATQVAGGRPPDIFQLGIDTLSEYADRGAVRPLDELVPDPLRLDRVDPHVLASCRHRGTLSFIPTGLSTQPALICNLTQLRRLGLRTPAEDWLLEDFRAFVHQVRRVSDKRLYGTSDLGGDFYAFEAFARTHGTNLFTPGGELAIGRDLLTDWYALWDELRRTEGCVPMAMTAEGGGFENTPLVKGTAVISPAASAKGIEGFASLTRDTLDFLPFPRLRADGPTGTVVTPVEWWAISAAASDEKARTAARFCDFALTDRASARGMAVEHGVPLFAGLRSATYATASATTRKTFDAHREAARARPVPRQPYPAGAGELIGTVFGRLNQDIGFGRGGVRQAVDRFFHEAERILGGQR